METPAREKFTTQVNADLLASVRTLAKVEGRQNQALVDEALADLIEKRKHSRPRPHVMTAYQDQAAPLAAITPFEPRGLYRRPPPS